MRRRGPREIVPHPSDPTLALVPLTRGKWAVIDAAYAVEVGRFNWCAAKSVGAKTFYASTRGHGSLHRFVACLAGMDVSRLVDHRNLNGLDCRTENLRAATKSTNAQNRGLDKNNRSGVKGVHFESFTGQWRAEIWVGGKHVRLGRFASLDLAEAAVSAARRELHGEFANDGKGTLQ